MKKFFISYVALIALGCSTTVQPTDKCTPEAEDVDSAEDNASSENENNDSYSSSQSNTDPL